uniref:Pectinesterase n=1 Tax=Oryza glaberrima TaxID=4538 RepID=I1QQX9_ORYGL
MAILDSNPPPAADAVVAADGSGDYTTIAAAVAAAPSKSTKRYVIYIKKGTYNELITIGQNTWNLTLIGDGMDVTIITGNQSVGGGVSTTSKTGTVTVDGIGFVAIDLTIENTAGAENEQAVALLSNSDASALYRCGIRVYQDTLYAKSNRTDVSNVYYGEYENTGDGADVSGRVKWTSFHVIQDASEAAKYTVENFIQGDKWIPGTGVYFEPSH